MRKNFGPKSWLYPMPVLIIGTYDEKGNPNAMNAGWGGICGTDEIMICLAEKHKTTENIRRKGAFTISFGTAPQVAGCDYVGLVSGHDVPDKFEKAGFHAIHADLVDAPVIQELKLTLECRLVRFGEDGICIGRIVNVSADESILSEDGTIDINRLEPLCLDGCAHVYRKIGDVAGRAFSEGKKLI